MKAPLDDQRLRHTLSMGVIGELGCQIRRQAKRVLGPHG
jgi:hypothetical protein